MPRKTQYFEHRDLLYRLACWLLALALLAGSLNACGPRVLVGPSRSDSIQLPYPVWMVAERDEPGGYMPGDPFDVYLIAQDGALRRVTDQLEWNPRPAWSPDGETVAFWAERGSGYGFQYLLYTAGASGTEIKPLTTRVGSAGSGSAAAKWSPKGDRLAFVAEDSAGEHLYVINKDGSNLIDLMDVGMLFDPYSYSWSPDGEHIAVESEHERHLAIHLVRFAPELEVVDLTSGQSTKPTSAWSPVWSPDGSRIACFSAAGIAVIEVETGATKVLTDDYGRTSGPLIWSPDGNWIAFGAMTTVNVPRKCEDEEDSGTFQYLHLVASDGSQLIRLTPIDHAFFDWSPDSKKLAFTFCNDIYTVSIESNAELHKLTAIEKGYAGWPDWSPDGSMLLFSMAQVHIVPDRLLVDTLYAINADGSKQLTLTDGSANVHEYGWLNNK